MSVAAPPRPTGGSNSVAGTHDKGEMVAFWRSALEHIARGIVAHQEVTRYTRASEIYSSRTKQTLRTDQAAQDATAKAAPHKEIFESCIHTLAKLSPPGLMQPAPANNPSLDTRIAALENETEKLFTKFQALETQHDAFCDNLSLIDAAARSSEETASDAIIRGDKSRAALEERIASLSSRIDAGPSPSALAAATRDQEQFITRIGSLDDAFRDFMKSSEASFNTFKDRTSQIEKRTEEWEKLRPKINEHSNKLAITEGKLNELRQNAEDDHRKLGTLLPLVSEVKALSLVQARITRTEESIENLKKDHRDVKNQLSSTKATFESAELRISDSCNQGLATLTTEVAVLEPLKRHVKALAALPNTIGQLEKDMLKLAPLQAQSEGLLDVAARASDIISSISDKERVGDSIAELRSKVSRCNEFNENAASAQKDILEVIELTSERVTSLSSQSQIVQENLVQTKALVAQLEGSIVSALDESRAVSAKIGAIDAKTKAGNFTAEWLKKQIEIMREQMAYLEPLGARVEALMLLAGQTEALMPLAAQFGDMSREIQRLWEESEATEVAMASAQQSIEVFKLNEPRFQDRLDKLAVDLTTASEESKQRLGQLEINVTQLESDTSTALEKLSELRCLTRAEAVRAKEDQRALEKAQTEIASLVPLKGHLHNLVSLSRQCTPLGSIVQDFQDFKRKYTSDSASLASQIKVVDVASTEIVRPLREQASESSRKITSLSSQCEQLQTRLESIERVEARITDVENSNKQLRAKLEELKKPAVATKESDMKGQAAVITGMQRKAKKLVEELQPLRDNLQSLEALSGKAGELMSLAQKVQTMEDNCALACKKSSKRLEEFKDTVYSLDQLVTGCTSKADANQLALDLLEREFKATKDVNESKHKEVEATLKGLAPLQERSERLVALVNTPSPDPASAVRVTELERVLKSLQKEMTNVAKTLLWMDPDVRALKSQASQFKALDSRLSELSESVKKTVSSLSPLGDRAPALLALLDKPVVQVSSPMQLNKFTSEQKKALADIRDRMDALEEGIQGLRTVKPKDLKPISTGLETVTQVVDELLVPFMEKAKPLLSLSPLADHVQSFLPLIDQVAQLQALTKSLSERALAAAAVEPGPASQLRSPLSERDISRPASPALTPLFSTPVGDDPKPHNRLKRKREIRAMFDSLEDQIEGVRSEVEGVADEVRQLAEERAKFKRQKTSEAPVQVTVQSPDEIHKIEQDLDCVMDTVTKLWTGKDGWPERLDLMLGKQWASVLGVELKGAGSAFVALRADIEVLKLAIEARGSGCTASTTPVVQASHIAGMEVLADRVLENVAKQQDEFREQLEARLNKVLRPIKNMYKALQSEEFD